jgi:hypothetical protein
MKNGQKANRQLTCPERIATKKPFSLSPNRGQSLRELSGFDEGQAGGIC